MTQAELQVAMAAQHQAVDAALAGMVAAGGPAAGAAQAAQAALASAQAQIGELAAQGPGAITPEHAVELQMAGMQQAMQLVASTGVPGMASTQLLGSLMAQTGQALQLQQQAAAEAPAVHDDPAIAGPPVDDDDDDFDDDIMAGHLDQRSDLMQRLDADGDGQIDRGILGPRVAADDHGLDWQDAQGDALLGDQAVPAVAPTMATGDVAEPEPIAPSFDPPPDLPDAPVDDVMAPPADDVAPIAPVEVPDDVADAPVDDAPDLPDEPPPPPEPVTHDDADWLN
jgi:hypothetical protein